MTSVMTATTDVVISEKSMLELASVEFSGTAVSRMSVMRIWGPLSFFFKPAFRSQEASVTAAPRLRFERFSSSWTVLDTHACYPHFCTAAKIAAMQYRWLMRDFGKAMARIQDLRRKFESLNETARDKAGRA